MDAGVKLADCNLSFLLAASHSSLSDDAELAVDGGGCGARRAAAYAVERSGCQSPLRGFGHAIVGFLIVTSSKYYLDKYLIDIN